MSLLISAWCRQRECSCGDGVYVTLSNTVIFPWSPAVQNERDRISVRRSGCDQEGVRIHQGALSVTTLLNAEMMSRQVDRSNSFLSLCLFVADCLLGVERFWHQIRLIFGIIIARRYALKKKLWLDYFYIYQFAHYRLCPDMIHFSGLWLKMDG